MKALLFWSFYLVVVVFLVVIAIFQHVGDDRLVKFNSFISEYSSLFLSLGTIFLLAMIALFTTVLTVFSSERQERVNRRIQAELKIAEFRQSWINEMRNDMAFLSSCLWDAHNGGVPNQEFHCVLFKVKVRLNLREETLAKKLYGAMTCAFEVASCENTEKEKKMEKFEDFTLCSHEFLKGEWDRLKKDLKAAQVLTADLI